MTLHNVEKQRGVTLDGGACRERRRARGLTQEQLADTARGAQALSLATIKRAERGLAIDLLSAQTLASLLDVDLEKLRASASLCAAADSGTFGNEPGRRPAIAVLPFELIAPNVGDPAHQFLGSGLADDLLNRLGAWWFPVISRCSTGSLPPHLDAHAIGERLDARYLIGGSVRRNLSGLRASVHVTDTQSGLLVWAGAFDRGVHELFELRDDLSDAIATAVGRSLLHAETQRSVGGDPASDVDAWDLALRGAWHYYRFTKADTVAARALLARAISRDPTLRCARYWLCMSLVHELSQNWSDTGRATLQQLREAVHDFRRQAPHDAYMHTARAYAQVYEGDRPGALESLLTAVEICPNLARARSLLGQVMAMGGQADEALDQLQVALKLSPLDPHHCAFKTGLSLAYFVRGDYAQMVHWSEAALRDDDQAALAYASLACARSELGDLSGARAALGALLRRPRCEDSLRMLMASTEPEIGERFIAALRRAGLPALLES